MKYSVIVPVYNTEPYLRQCAESVLRQTYRDFEVILVDDGSPDRCPAICEELRRQDGRVKVIHQRNSGPGIARNTGIEAAQGEYIVFLDSDDYWLKDTVLETVDRQLRGCDLAVFDLQRLTDGILAPPDMDGFLSFEDGYAAGDDFLGAVLEKQPSFNWYFYRYVFNRRLFSAPELRFSAFTWCEDVALLYRVILKAKQVRIVKESFYAYRQDRQDSASRTVTYEALHGVLSVADQEITRVKAMPGLSAHTRELLCSNLCIEYFTVLPLSCLLSGREREMILEELSLLRRLADFGRKKGRAKAVMIRLLGVRTTARMLDLKRKILKRGQR